MIYTSSLDLSPSQQQSRAEALSMRNLTTRVRSLTRQSVAVMREAIAKSRAALASTNGFGAQ